MSLSLSPMPKLQFFNNNGLPLSGGNLYTYNAGQPGVPKATYTDGLGTTYNTNPIVLDTAGRASIWLEGVYYMELWTGDKTLVGSTLLWTQDNVTPLSSSNYFKNALNTITSFFTNANTVARTYTFQDRDGTIADNTDLATKSPLAGPGSAQAFTVGALTATTFNTIPISTGAGAVASNTAVGVSALLSNTTGYYNTATGLSALYSNTTGYVNTANGLNTLYFNTTGYYNTANGVNTLYSNTTGYYNTANGVNALYYMRPTSKAISAFADYGATVAGTVKATSVAHGLTGVSTKQITGTTNYNGSFSITVIDVDTFYFTATWVATQTGWWSIATEANQNTATGMQAGMLTSAGANNVTSSSSVYLGCDTRSLASGDVNEIVIGYAAIGNGSNTVTIGNTGITTTILRGNVVAGQFSLSALNTAPASATAVGTLGEIRVTASAIYVCTATNTWVKAALATW